MAKKINESYDLWSKIYDINENKTRDLEAFAQKQLLEKYKFNNCLEIGCGTGKNSLFLLSKAKNITAVDFSEKMLQKAKQKIKSPNINFIKADISKEWKFINRKFDFISFSLVLEHIESIDFIFRQIEKLINQNGFVYIGELHPFKQYSGTKARFETIEGIETLKCFTHNISEFIKAALKYNFKIVNMNEFFDDNESNNIPRIISFLFQKQT